MDSVTVARQNASLREEFLRRGLTTADQLDRVGWVAHSDLDLWSQAGVLEPGVLGLQEAWGLGLLRGDVFNRRVIRDRSGRFGLGMGPHVVPGAQSNRRIKRNVTPRIKRIERPPTEHGPIATIKRSHGKKDVHVFATPTGVGDVRHEHVEGTFPERMSARQFKQEVTARNKVHAAGDKRLARLAKESRRAATKATKEGDHATAAAHHVDANAFETARADPKQTFAHGQAELYARRTESLEKRIKRKVGKAGEKITPAAGQARGEHDLSSAEVHFNDAGRVSQKTLLAYVEEAATKPTTAEMYRDKQGNYHPSRAALHAHIIDMLLRQHATDAEGGDAGLSATTEHLKPPEGDPTVIFTGGGYAAGKGGVVKMLKRRGEWPDDALLLDPDLIKAELPEFQLAAMDDPEANLRVYTEAWDIAQAAMKQAQDKGLNVVVDGITDTSPQEVAKRVKSFTDKGYVNPRIQYVSVPTDEAIKRAKSRAAKAETAADRRMIPEVIMRSVHRDVSATMPGVLAAAKDMGVHVQVYDTDQGKDEVSGKFNPPKLVAEATPEGHVHYPDPTGYQAIVNKAQETISGVPDVQAPPRGAWKTGGQITKIDPAVEKSVGKDLAASMPSAPEVELPNPTGDPEKLMALAHSKGQAHFQALLDLGQGIADALGAQTHDVSEGKSFDQVTRDIAANMGKSHVIIAPVKDHKRALDKVASLGHEGDLSNLHDVLRATATVPTAQDLPHAIAEITRQVEARGWKVERTTKRMVDKNGSKRLASGYGDTRLVLRAPPEAGGMLAELQVNTNPMWHTKEAGPGHKLFELERQVTGRQMTEKRAATPDEQSLVGELHKAAKPLYDRAWGASLNGGVTGDPATALGTKEERAAAAGQLKTLAAKTAGLMGGPPTPTTQRGRLPRAA